MLPNKNNERNKLIKAHFAEFAFEALRNGDFATMEQEIVKEAMKFCREGVAAAIEILDSEMMKRRDKKLLVKSVDSRSITAMFGYIPIKRRRYYNQETRKTFYLLDEMVGIAPYDYYSPAFRHALVTSALDSSYESASKLMHLYTGENANRTTVRNSAIETAKIVKSETIENSTNWNNLGISTGEIETETLFTEADSVYVHKQRKNKKEPRGIDIKIMKTYTGKSNGSCENSKVYAAADANSEFWARASGEIFSHIKFDSVQKSYLGTDGEQFYKNGIDVLPIGTIHKLDPWHLRKLIKQSCDSSLQYTINRIIYNENNIPKAIGLLNESIRRTVDIKIQEKLEILSKYLSNNIDSIHNDGPTLGTMEATNAHVVGARCKSAGGAWSQIGADAIVRLKAKEASRGEIPFVYTSAVKLEEVAKSEYNKTYDECYSFHKIPETEGKGYLPPQASFDHLKPLWRNFGNDISS